MIMKDQDMASSVSSSFHEYNNARVAISDLEEEKARVLSETTQAQQTLILLLLTLPVESQAQSQSHPQIRSVTNVINDNNRRLTNIVI